MDRYSLRLQLRAVTGCAEDDISDVDFDRILHADLNLYLRYCPGTELTLAATGLATVANQPSYAAPEGCLWPIAVAWNPDLTSSEADATVDDFYLRLFGGGFNPDWTSELHVEYQKLAEYRRFFAGDWQWINNKIWLVPMPTESGTHVPVFFAKERTVVDLAAIKDERLFELLKSSLWIRMGQDANKGGAWRAGTLSVDNSKVAAQLLKSGEALRNRVLHELENPSYAAKSGPSLVLR